MSVTSDDLELNDDFYKKPVETKNITCKLLVLLGIVIILSGSLLVLWFFAINVKDFLNKFYKMKDDVDGILKILNKNNSKCLL